MPDTRDSHRDLRDTKVALTIDDAPTIAASPGGVFPDPARMDRIREMLQAANVRHCVAFVVGNQAERETARLTRWLEAGYELGNHTWSHYPSSAFEPNSVLEDVRRCDRLLSDVGAFERGRQRWFRFPYLDRGRWHWRQAIHDGVLALGYRTVHGTVDWYDHRYEEALSRALARDDRQAVRRVEQRFVAAALRSTRHEVSLARRRLGRPLAHIAYCHFGEAALRSLPPILSALEQDGVKLCAVSEASADPIYAQFDRPPLGTGRLPAAMLEAGACTRAARVLARWTVGLGLFGQARLGPLWPHLD